ncbi:GLPGLI family protein [Flavobacterium ardleyense]|uniref:GLPGLI family protein n=1 Tax=Flavobacterium ardleyense TaxID=2038737 RepID=A0ABW5Z4K4_9FLAO
MKNLKVLIFIIYLLSINNKSNAQEVNFETVIKYQYTFQSDSTDAASKENEEMLLLVNSKKSFFISNAKFTLDTLKSKNLNVTELLALKNSIPKNKIKFEVEKNKDKKSINYFETIFITTYLDANTKPVLNWKLVEEKKNISGYLCRKATTTFAGRDYVAWFTNEVPIIDGPYKFSGLPGLIIEIYDTKNHHFFSMISLQSKNIAHNIQHRNIIEANMKEITKVRNNQISNLQNSGFNVTPEMIKKAKEKLAKMNNPIELATN